MKCSSSFPCSARVAAGALNAAAGFAVTIAIGEAACVWLAYQRRGLTAPSDEVRRAFADGLAAALRQAKKFPNQPPVIRRRSRAHEIRQDACDAIGRRRSSFSRSRFRGCRCSRSASCGSGRAVMCGCGRSRLPRSACWHGRWRGSCGGAPTPKRALRWATVPSLRVPGTSASARRGPTC